MKACLQFALAAVMLISSVALAQSPFNGTWRPDPQRPGTDRKPDIIQIVNGEYDCQSCKPPYKIKANGTDQPIPGNPRFDTLRVTVVDDRTITTTGKKSGATVLESRAQVSPDGRELTETELLSNIAPQPMSITSRSSRVAAGPQGSHRVSGSWRLVEFDLTNHDEDTTYSITGDTLTMSDHMGRSFAAKLGGIDAPYRGDPHYTSVSVKLIDPRTLEELDKKDGQVVQINRWTVDPDGKTMHARFDDTHGHVQQQTGHKLSD